MVITQGFVRTSTEQQTRENGLQRSSDRFHFSRTSFKSEELTSSLTGSLTAEKVLTLPHPSVPCSPRSGGGVTSLPSSLAPGRAGQTQRDSLGQVQSLRAPPPRCLLCWAETRVAAHGQKATHQWQKAWTARVTPNLMTREQA